MNIKSLKIIALITLMSFLFLYTPAEASLHHHWVSVKQNSLDDDIAPEQSTSGPIPSLQVQQRDSLKTPDNVQDTKGEVIIPVPAYEWRHGCGPTALSMVIGYYDATFFSDLVAGDAWTQTDEVDQMIASGGDIGSPFPPGSEGHFEDYASPVDSSPILVPDDYITAGRIPHVSNSLADYMSTSMSTRNNYYGWSWSNDVGPSFVNYIEQQQPALQGDYQQYYSGNGTFTWNVFVHEIDSGRPMVFLVDTDGNGGTDHFITAVGYRTEPTLQYAAWDTWSTTEIRWENFAYIASGVPWGIWGGLALGIAHPPYDISISNNTIAENSPPDTTLGTFSTSDPLVGDTFTYYLTSGIVDNDNEFFKIAGDQLLPAVSFNFEEKSSYTIRVTTFDSLNQSFSEDMSITISNVHEAPTDITISNQQVNENIIIGTEIGVFSSTDEDSDETFVYSLVSGTGDVDNSIFTIADNRLITAGEIDFEIQSNLSLRIRSTDSQGLFFEKIINITVLDINDDIHFIYLPCVLRN